MESLRVYRVNKPKRLTLLQAVENLEARGWRGYVGEASASSAPRGVEGGIVTLHLFNLDLEVDNETLAAEFERRGLVPDPVALALLNYDEPRLFWSYPTGAHWRDRAGGWHGVKFQPGDGKPFVFVITMGIWPSYVWFGGVPI